MLGRIREFFGRVFASLDALSARLSRVIGLWFLWPFFYGAAFGSGVWALTHRGDIPMLDTNKLPQPDRIKMIIWAGIGFAIVALGYTAVLVAGRVRKKQWRFIETVTALNRRCSFFLALPIAAALTLPSIEKDSPKMTLFLAFLGALVIGKTVHGWTPMAPRSAPADEVSGDDENAKLKKPRRAWVGPAAAWIGVALLFVGYSLFFSWIAITHHHALGTRTTDLGYYDNIFYQSIHGHPLGCSFIRAGYHGSAHFDPILVLLSPLYLVYPRAEFLLILQSVWLGAGVFPVFLLAKDRLGHRLPAVLLAAMWAIYPAMHGANLYEFHSLTLISPLVVWLLFFYETQRRRLYFGMLFLLLLCREDVALLMCFVGLYQLLARREGSARMGWTTILASLAYFAIVKVFFMTSAGIFMSGKDAYSFAYYYDALMPHSTGLGGLFISVFTNPVFAIKTALEEQKIVFVVTLFLPLAGLPFLAKGGRVMLLYGMLFCLLASRGAVFSTHFQYSSVLFPIAFALTPITLGRMLQGEFPRFQGQNGRRMAWALLGAAFAASLVVSWKFGGILENQSFKGGFVRIFRGMSDEQRAQYAWVREQVSKIPKDAPLGVTNRLGPHASNRLEAFFYPDKPKVDWALIDEAEVKGKELDQHKKMLAEGTFVEVARRGKLVLLKRKGPVADPPPGPSEGEKKRSGDGEKRKPRTPPPPPQPVEVPTAEDDPEAPP